MKLTEALRKWAAANCDLSADASDADIKAAIAAALAKDEGSDGYLAPEKYRELTRDPDAEKADTLTKTLTSLAEGQEKLVTALGAVLDRTAAPPEAKQEEPDEEKDEEPEEVKAEVTDEVKEKLPGSPSKAAVNSTGGVTQPRAKGAWERYSTTKSEVRYPEKNRSGRRHSLAGQRVAEGYKSPRYIDEPSELEKAQVGAWIKHQMNVQSRGDDLPRAFRMTDHDRDLVRYTLDTAKFGGVIGADCDSVSGAVGVNNRVLTDGEKALIDDAVSGGLELAPIFFDDQVILTPLLFGELFPLVNLVNITRGRRIEGASMGNVTLTWGGGDDTATALFATAAFVAAFDTTIFVVDGAIEIGMDFMSDSPVEVASIITTQYGERLLEELDTVIARGNGATEPEGIINAAGVTTVAFGGVAPTVGGYEQLLFGVPKQIKAGFGNERSVFASNETSYRRARAIPVGAGDERRVFGMTHEDYRMFDRDYKIVSNMLNTEAFFANLGRYRMYRRLGLTVRRTVEGTTLVRRNMALWHVRARYGGQTELGAANSIATTLQA